MIRRATKEDAPSLIDYMKALCAEPDIGIPLSEGEFDLTVEEEASVIEKTNANPLEIFLVAVDGARVVGVLSSSANRRRANAHDISFGITVAREYRHQGIGRSLMNAFIAWAQSVDGITSIHLTVWKSNRNAIRLYREYGFKKCGERRYSVFKYGRFQPVISMEVLL